MSEKEKDQKIEKLARENAVLREKIAELERRLGIVLVPDKFVSIVK